MRLSFASLLAIAAVSASDDFEPIVPAGWKVLTAADDLAQIDEVICEPYPPVRGSKLSSIVRGSIAEEITGGIVKFQVVYYGATLASGQVDICESLQRFPQYPQCPLPAGEFEIPIEGIEVPFFVPPGTFHITTEAFTNDDKRIFAVDGSVSFGLFTKDALDR